MPPSTINLILNTLIVITCISFVQSIILMIGGAKLFKKANKDEKSAYIPVVNLFTLLDIAEMSTFWGILFFAPLINIFVISLLSVRVGKVFNTSLGFKIGLVALPFIFYPMLAYSDKTYKFNDPEFFKAFDNAKADNINLLMTEEEIKMENSQEVDEGPVVDSVFKAHIETKETATPYKAVRVESSSYDRLQTETQNMFTPIERTNFVPEPTQELKEKENQKRFTSELEKEEEIEFVEL